MDPGIFSLPVCTFVDLHRLRSYSHIEACIGLDSAGALNLLGTTSRFAEPNAALRWSVSFESLTNTATSSSCAPSSPLPSSKRRELTMCDVTHN